MSENDRRPYMALEAEDKARQVCNVETAQKKTKATTLHSKISNLPKRSRQIPKSKSKGKAMIQVTIQRCNKKAQHSNPLAKSSSNAPAARHAKHQKLQGRSAKNSTVPKQNPSVASGCIEYDCNKSSTIRDTKGNSLLKEEGKKRKLPSSESNVGSMKHKMSHAEGKSKIPKRTNASFQRLNEETQHKSDTEKFSKRVQLDWGGNLPQAVLCRYRDVSSNTDYYVVSRQGLSLNQYALVPVSTKPKTSKSPLKASLTSSGRDNIDEITLDGEHCSLLSELIEDYENFRKIFELESSDIMSHGKLNQATDRLVPGSLMEACAFLTEMCSQGGELSADLKDAKSDTWMRVPRKALYFLIQRIIHVERQEAKGISIKIKELQDRLKELQRQLDDASTAAAR